SLTLNNYRTTVILKNLDPPDPVLEQHLRGAYVKILYAISDTGHPAYSEEPYVSNATTSRPYDREPPSVPSPYFFDFDADSDAFSAVCLYYHIDSFFSMLVNMGFTFGSVSDFPNIPMPLAVDHWGNDGANQSGLGAGVLPNVGN